MHPAVIDTTGYTLLLSNIITLVILLWKGCKRKRSLPFYVLSTSDVFSATLTAVILLVNHIEAGIRLSYKWQNNTSSDTSNHPWTIEDNYQFPFLLQTRDLHEAVNVTLTCDMKDILLQYGMLLAALTNAFISLLTFTVQCNLNATCAKRRCANVMKSLKDAQPEDVDVKRREGETSENEEEPQRDNVNAKNGSNIQRRIMKISKFPTLKEDDNRPTSFLVTSHWFVPLLVTGILYFAEYSDMNNNARNTEDIECVFGSNFPMSDLDTFLGTDDNLNVTDAVTRMTPLEHNYFLREKLSNNSSSADIDEIVFKVQNIVRAALGYTYNTHNSTEDVRTTNILDTPQNFTRYILTNNIMRYVKNITNINTVVQGLNGTLIERDVNVSNLSTNDNTYLNQDSKVSLFYDMSKNASGELDATTSESLSSVSRMSIENKDDGYQEDAPIHFTSTEESTTEKTADTSFVRDKTFVSNNQIYNDIMKRIQAASVHSAAKNSYNRSVSRLKDEVQPEISSLKNYIAKRRPNSIMDLFSDESGSRYVNARSRQSGSLNMINECLVSTKFLKLQLFVLSFAIYFLPILLSFILQMRGKHMCKSTLAILRAKTDLTSTGGKKTHRQDSVEGSSTPQRSRKHHSWTDVDAINKDRECCRENESIALEIDCMVRIFDTIRLSLILCIVLWTPVFLGTLLRVYSCIHVPQWLNDITFLSAISFGVVRNALNINIIRIQEACGDVNLKENRIHPVE